MKKNLLLLIAIFICATSFAQGEVDALRLSRNDLSGTARGQAMAGAFGALGGDVTGVSINPAGLGVYRSSEVSATMNFASANMETPKSTQNAFKFNFNNLSYVGYFPLGNNSMSAINFGFSYNRLKNFNRKYSTSTKGMTSSLTDYMAVISDGAFVGDFEGRDPYRSGEPWLGILGWNGFFINDVTDYKYESPLDEGETVNSFLSVSEEGYIDSYDFSIGTNLFDNLYLGLTFTETDIYYRMNSYYDEEFQNGGRAELKNYLETEGTGYQLRLGAIWRPVDEFRVGIAYHSPTWYSLTDYYSGNTLANYGDVSNEKASTPSDAYTNYKLQTPQSCTFSVAGVIGAKAILSVDYEVKDYTAMDFKDDSGFEYEFDNQCINEDFKVTSTIRAGLEYRFTPQFSGRLGYAWMQNPYVKEMKEGKKEVVLGLTRTTPHYTIEGDVSYFTAGIGYRFTPQFYIDATFVRKSQTDDLYYFSPTFENGNILVDSKSTSLKNNTYNTLITLGYKF